MTDEQNEEGAPKRLIDTTPLAKEDQIKIAERLQAASLRLFLDRVENRTISDTGLATIVRMLIANGWDLDPSHMKQDLKDLLTSTVSAEELDKELDNVFPIGSRRPA